MNAEEAAKLTGLPLYKRGDDPEFAEYPEVKFAITDMVAVTPPMTGPRVEPIAHTRFDGQLYVRRARVEPLDDATSILTLRDLLLRRIHARIEYQKRRIAERNAQ